MSETFFSSPGGGKKPTKTISKPGMKTSKPTKANRPAKKRKRVRFFNIFLLIAIIAAISLFAWAEKERRATEQRLEQTEKQLEEIKKSAEGEGSDVAKEVLAKVGQLIDLPTDPEPTVATIVNAEELRANNVFYEKAKNGDQVIITTKKAILYDPERNIIIDVAPVRLETASPSPQASQGSPSPDSSIDPEASPTSAASPPSTSPEPEASTTTEPSSQTSPQ